MLSLVGVLVAQVEQRAQKRITAEQSLRKAAQEELDSLRQREAAWLASPSAAAAAAASAGGLSYYHHSHLNPQPSMRRSHSGFGGNGGGGMPEPPAMAGPGFKWVLVREDEGLGGGSGEGGPEYYGEHLHEVPESPSIRRSESTGIGHGSILTGRGFTAADLGLGLGVGGHPGSPAGSSRSGSFMYHDAVAHGGPGKGAVGAGGAVAASHQEAMVERLRAALRQKLGEVGALEGRVRELEATRSSLAEELVAATTSSEQVRADADGWESTTVRLSSVPGVLRHRVCHVVLLRLIVGWAVWMGNYKHREDIGRPGAGAGGNQELFGRGIGGSDNFIRDNVR